MSTVRQHCDHTALDSAASATAHFAWGGGSAATTRLPGRSLSSRVEFGNIELRDHGEADSPDSEGQRSRDCIKRNPFAVANSEGRMFGDSNFVNGDFINVILEIDSITGL
jgi:hypothetical protein